MGVTHLVTLPNDEEFELNYEDDIEVDRTTLDRDWERHSKMSFAYSVALASARENVQNLKREHKVMIAETILDVKKNRNSSSSRV